MAIHAGRPVTAGLSQVARMDRRERARLVRELSRQHPTFRSLWRQVMLARGIAFTSVLALALAVILLVQADVPTRWVSALVLGGLAGFAYVAIVLTDHRFDLLLAVLGAHRTDELHGRLLNDELYGAEAAEKEAPPSEPADHPGEEGADDREWDGGRRRAC
ncbi:hypothetical protein GCM10027271_27770 [Saccharopolyspora gloriosae]|uniref:Uncharacterized protein n=1 Tax=Saccharopolyspora gloriosae TaxID=455344 RepID=A0A840NII0_9PSEU|nr:hypothetical protein [Saccharopolyspora gloriosae]MBB5071384.1 hypothetical protein [Saccharopolyspora gloriosae]